MNSIAIKSPQAAVEFVGGDKQLAMPVGMTQSLLGTLVAGRYQVPDPMLLQAVDILLAHRQSLIPLAATRTSRLGGDSSQ